MFSTAKIAAAISFTAVLTLLSFSGPADAKTICRHNARDCHVSRHVKPRRDWYLHRPSTPRERAQTRALNAEALASTTPAQNFAGRDDGPRQYQRELREYRAARQRYEQDMRWYSAVTGPRRPAYDRREMSSFPRPPHPPAGMERRDERPYGYGPGAAGY